jgi:phage gp37-like protein
MGMISSVEDAIIAAAGTALGATVRTIETVPGGWTMDSLSRALQFAPGVYVAFIGGQRGSAGRGHMDGQFMVYVVTKGAREPDRRRGNPREIGAYDILELLYPRLDGLAVTDIGNLDARGGIDNLFRDAMFDLGGTVYGLGLTVPNMPFDYLVNDSGLDDFLRTFVNYDLAPTDGTIDASDQIDLPQE